MISLGYEKIKATMKIIEFDREGLEKVFLEAQNFLLSDSNVMWFKFDSSLNCLNHLEILDLVKNTAIVYCIWVSRLGKIIPVYVGHSTSKYSKQRITNHFIKKDPRTGSQLERIFEEINMGNQVGLSFLKIEPDYMRKPFEEWLISMNSRKLVWNKRGK